VTAKVSAALVAIQGDLRNPAKDKTANTGTYSYKYADLASILDLLRPILAKHGCAIVQDVRMEDGRLLISTRLIHSSGECLEFGPLAGSVGSSWQQTGGGITYARRYALQAIFGIAADEDDDAATAPPPTSKPKKLRAVEKTATKQDLDRLFALIAAATTWIELKSVGEEISTFQMDDETKHALKVAWTERKGSLS